MRVLTLLVTHSESGPGPSTGTWLSLPPRACTYRWRHVPREARGLVPHSRSLWSLQTGMTRWDTGHSLDAAHRGDPTHTHTHTLLGEVLSSVELCSHGRRGPAAYAGSLALFPAVVCALPEWLPALGAKPARLRQDRGSVQSVAACPEPGSWHQIHSAMAHILCENYLGFSSS